jgi:hypothetical protein
MPVSQKALDQRVRYRDNFESFAHDCLTIRTKAGDLEQFTLNEAQRYIHTKLEQQRTETGKVRAIILKGRQQGCSTMIEGRLYWRAIHRFGVRAFILAHKKSSTDAIYEMAKRYHDNCPAALKPHTGTSNAKELVFDKLDSGYKMGTAGSDSGVGRGETLQYFHGSEVAFWPIRTQSDLSTGILQAIPDAENTEIILESTANGQSGYFYSEVQKALRGEGDFQLIFTPWFWSKEYRRPHPIDFEPSGDEIALMNEYDLDPEQIMWRRNKIISLTIDNASGEGAFKQEYPNNVEEAFQASNDDGFISTDWFDAAIDAHLKLGFTAKGSKFISYDPSDGGDPHGLAYRHGSVFLDVDENTINDVNAGCDWSTDYAIAVAADYYNWDCDGLGVSLRRQISEALAGKKIDFQEYKGSNSVDYPKKAYDEKASGGRPKSNKDTFKNKRAQYGWLLRDKFYNTYRAVVMGEYIDPDDLISLSSDIKKLDKLRSEVCRVPLAENDNGLIQIMSKKAMKVLKIESPNMFDAMCESYACKMSVTTRRPVSIPSIRAKRMSR